MLNRLLLLIFVFLLGATASAKMRLVEWQTKNTLVPLILPVRESETPEMALERYMKNLNKDPGLMELFQGQLPFMETLTFKELSDKDLEERALLIANRPGDYSTSATRIEKFKLYFGKNNQNSYLLPINPNLGLSFTEKREVFDLISKKFPLLVAMGGDDVEPSSYKEKNFHSYNPVESRDREEIWLIKHYVTSARGFFLGICRGSQVASVALGYKLIQDIPLLIKEKNVAHGNDWHDIALQPTTHNILKSAAASSERIQVNSLHHQSVQYKPGGFLELAAVSPDGVVEATEFKNGRGLLLQFHPELMNNSLGFKILSQVVSVKKQIIPGRCGRLF